MSTSEMFVDDAEIEARKEQPVAKTDNQPKVENSNIIILPSNGRIGYPSEVSYRDIMVRDEEVLASAGENTYAKVLNGVLKAVLNDCSFFEELSVHDRDYLLLWIWSNNYGAKKKVTVKCSNQECGKESVHTVDMTALETNEIDEKFRKTVSIPVKKTGGTVSVRMNTVDDELFIEAWARDNPKKAKDYRYDTLMIVRSIDVGGNIPFDVKLQWIMDNMSSRELGMVKKYHEKFAFGVKPIISHTCPECGEVTQGLLPFQAEDILFPVVSEDFDGFLSTDEGDEDIS